MGNESVETVPQGPWELPHHHPLWRGGQKQQNRTLLWNQPAWQRLPTLRILKPVVCAFIMPLNQDLQGMNLAGTQLGRSHFRGKRWKEHPRSISESGHFASV